MISVKHMQHFCAVLEAGSIQAAAAALHITQPALTRSIANLEQELGVQLFERSRSGMSPTEFATGLAPRFSGVLLEIADITRDAQLYQNLEIGDLCVGYGQAIREPVTRLCVLPFVEENPGVALRIREGTSPELVTELQARNIDMIIAGSASYRENSFLRFEPICQLAIDAVVRKTHPLASLGRAATMEELLQYPLAGPTALGSQHPFLNNVSNTEALIRPHFMCSDYGVLQAIVASTDAWTVTFHSMFRHELPDTLQRLPVSDFNLKIDVTAMELAHRSRSPAAQRFVDNLRRVFGELAV